MRVPEVREEPLLWVSVQMCLLSASLYWTPHVHVN